MDNSVPKVSGHEPVLLNEVLEALRPGAGEVVADVTFGGGGYSRAILRTEVGRVLALDRDAAAFERGLELARTEDRFSIHHARFGDLETVLDREGLSTIDGIVADLGLSSFQLDDPARGFSFQHDGPLDMRMGAGAAGDPTMPSAADLLARIDEASLVQLLRDHGDEPDARRLARAILRERETRPITTTAQLRALAARVKGHGKGRIDPATRLFQALRIAVNHEQEELERLLEIAAARLAPGGRLVIVSFHSGEDRIVKRFLDHATGYDQARSRHLPPVQDPRPIFAVRRKAVKPGAQEIARNPRARSARMRSAVRTEFAPRADPGPVPPADARSRQVAAAPRCSGMAPSLTGTGWKRAA